MSETQITGGPDVMYERGRLYQLPLNELMADPDQPRKVIDGHSLDELTASIRKHGILNPVLFRRDEDGTLVIVAGERRIIAARKAGLTSVPALYIDGNSSEISLIENLLRQDLTVVEEAEALKRLMEQRKYTHEQLSAVIGKARTTISDILLINRLPQEVRNDCRGDRLMSKNVLIEIARKKQDRAMITAYRIYKEKLRRNGMAGRKKNKSDADALEPVMRMVEKIIAGLNRLDETDCAAKDRVAFRDTMFNLRTRIDAFLNAPPSQPPEERRTS